MLGSYFFVHMDENDRKPISYLPTPIVATEVFLNVTETRVLYSLAYSVLAVWISCPSVGLDIAQQHLAKHSHLACRRSRLWAEPGELYLSNSLSLSCVQAGAGLPCIAHAERKQGQLNGDVSVGSVGAVFLRTNWKSQSSF